MLVSFRIPIVETTREEIASRPAPWGVSGKALTLHIAAKLSDDIGRASYERALARHATVHWCGSFASLESVVAAGAGAALLELAASDNAEMVELVVRLRQEYRGLLLILGYDPAGEELADAVMLARRRLGLWFACEADDELGLLLARAAAGRIPAGPTPAELAVECVVALAPAAGARRFAWFCGLTPSGRLDEAMAAARCGEKLRTVQRQFAEIGLTAGGVRRALQVLHAAFWLRCDPYSTAEIAAVFGRRSARALREAVKDLLGVGVHQLRRSSAVHVLSSELASRLRAGSSGRHPRPRQTVELPEQVRRYRVVSRVAVTLIDNTIVATLGSGTSWVLTNVAGAVLVEVMQGRSPLQIRARLQREYGLTRSEARAAVDAALAEFSARGVVEPDHDRSASLPS